MRLLLAFLLVLSGVQGCTSLSNSGSMENEHKHTNKLINETSPYLLQHAHNPVDWYPWGEEALNKAQEENKLILVSVGYSACHWCHVMERESFEDSTVAAIMNENFVCIKVDREERPDVDDVYMTAVQLITRRGGWPLNCFALPDGRPIYGGTYFPKEQWTKILEQLSKDYQNNPEKWLEAADQLTEGIRRSDLLPINSAPADFQLDTLKSVVDNWKPEFDNKEGGPNRAPKFPLPNNYEFLLQYATLTGDQEVEKHVMLTLDKMAMGGIYDQIGGGFARYSTDIDWKVPHFEKMLYDNAQLLTLYSKAYQRTKKDLYKEVVYQTVDFISEELTDKTGAFYSALDADSEGEEGKYYVWTKEELKSALGEDYNLAKKYYNIDGKAFWEHGNNILLRTKSDAELASQMDLSVEELKSNINRINSVLKKVRSSRIKPGLDDKTLTSWNAMTISGLVDAYNAFGDQRFLEMALKNADFILSNQVADEGRLWHSYKAGISKQDGFLEDYCFVMEAWLGLYEATFDQTWLERAKDLADIVIEDFYNSDQGLFYFTNKNSEQLIARKTEVNDNVIPASNSSVAKALFRLGHYFDNKAYLNISQTMLNNVQPHMSNYPSGFSNWSQLYLYQVFPFYEVAISGKDLKTQSQKLRQTYIPNRMFIGDTKESSLPLMEGKYVEGATFIYVCVNKACQLPVESAEEALEQIKF